MTTEHDLYEVETPLVKMNSEHLSLSDSIFSGSMLGSLSGKTMIFNHVERIRKIPYAAHYGQKMIKIIF